MFTNNKYFYQRSLPTKLSEFESEKFVLQLYRLLRKTAEQSIDKPADGSTECHYFRSWRGLGWCRHKSCNGNDEVRVIKSFPLINLSSGPLLQLSKRTRKLCWAHENSTIVPETSCCIPNQQFPSFPTEGIAISESIREDSGCGIPRRMVTDANELSILKSSDGNARPDASWW